MRGLKHGISKQYFCAQCGLRPMRGFQLGHQIAFELTECRLRTAPRKTRVHFGMRLDLYCSLPCEKFPLHQLICLLLQSGLTEISLAKDGFFSCNKLLSTHSVQKEMSLLLRGIRCKCFQSSEWPLVSPPQFAHHQAIVRRYRQCQTSLVDH